MGVTVKGTNKHQLHQHCDSFPHFSATRLLNKACPQSIIQRNRTFNSFANSFVFRSLEPSSFSKLSQIDFHISCQRIGTISKELAQFRSLSEMEPGQVATLWKLQNRVPIKIIVTESKTCLDFCPPGPSDTSRHPQSSLEALRGRPGPPDTP